MTHGDQQGCTESPAFQFLTRYHGILQAIIGIQIISTTAPEDLGVLWRRRIILVFSPAASSFTNLTYRSYLDIGRLCASKVMCFEDYVLR
jgi:hypothetical protein